MSACAAAAPPRTEPAGPEGRKARSLLLGEWEDAMLRASAAVLIAILVATSSAMAAEMKPSAAEKMPSPAEKAKMKGCEAKAAAQNVAMDARAKFVMDCMTAK
jgi:hypothetical protein